jgi:4-amino-4-deoxy-L-arabinose transferase-like glycosyltransferase
MARIAAVSFFLPMTNRTRTDALLLAGFCAFLFFYGLAQFGLIGADEPRYAQVAREMLERGDWITPTLGGRPWLEKPPLYYWQAMVAYKVFGASDWAARLPSAFDATFLVLTAYFFLRIFLRGVELDGALIVSSCAGIIGYARAASTDMPLAVSFGLAMLSWWAWYATEKKIYLAAFFAFLALGALAKGPVAPFLAFFIIAIYAAAIRSRRPLLKTFWAPGVVLFFALALPWYVAVQARNPEFFREFILEQNLGRFSHNIYHHVEPVWYYLPVALLALVPWVVFVVLAVVEIARKWWFDRERIELNSQEQLALFAACWLIVPAIFFSFSASKLPGYILPALPAGALLLAYYLHQGQEENPARSPRKLLIVLHAIVAAAPIVPALLIAFLVTQHRIPAGKPISIAIIIAVTLGCGLALTLFRSGLRMLRFVTLIPVVLAVAAVLKLGSPAIDRSLSARPLAREIASLETQPMQLAVYHVPRELEYGLTFYRNQLTFNYDWGSVPAQAHLLVAPENSQVEIAKLVSGRRVSYLGNYPPQHVDYYWVGPEVPRQP